MKKSHHLFTLAFLLLSTIFLGSWDLWDNAKKKVKNMLDGENPEATQLINAKLDTLQSTADQMEHYQKMSNKKFAEVEYKHLRIARELRYCVAGIVSGAGRGKSGVTINNGGASSGNDPDSRFARATQGWGGGHINNLNWVSGYFPYDESLDYEYVDEVYPFDESNPLPTATSK